MPVIKVEHLTKDYGFGRGVFDVSFAIEKGQVFGFLGPNGAGKTTTIRHIMGFSNPDIGTTEVQGLESFENSQEILKNLGYLPGEIALPENLTGTQFIKYMADMRGIKDMTYTNELVKKFQLDPSGKLKRMSLGMKRKLAIVTAFMHDPEILVLDEPTSGLDPVMQRVFIDFICEQKKRGKTILLSSHIFNEVEATCDIISIIKDGRVVSTCWLDDIKIQKKKTYKIEFADINEYTKFLTENLDFVLKSEEKHQVRISIRDEDINKFIKLVTKYRIKFFAEQKYSLEDYFMRFYEKSEQGVLV
ncbi:MAG: ABC transporter ATP-binding protein [Acholeplasmatales bacterium]|jgi:ABC-2 type transport system ATP-binding protein|nr:ABC transporter ATP-binding protein [Acholeplasmatales bacterium]